jgi:phage N-6-adenine-methyltransferase
MKYQLFPNLTADEMEALTADIKDRGVMVPVEVDEAGEVLDGHHRAMIADSLGLPYPTIVRDGWDELQKLTHVIALNAHRRHLTGDQRAEVVARLRKEGKSLRAIAGVVRVDVATVHRDLSGVADATPERVNGSDGKSYAATHPTPFRPRLDPVGYFATPTPPPAPVVEPEKWSPGSGLMSSESVDWYTPKRVLDAVVAAMGGIDLDPCADPDKSVPATTHYVEADDGLAQDWTGRVYMNPPYGRGIEAWVTKLASAHKSGAVTEAIALLPGRIETDWFYAVEAEWFCNIEGRLAFSGHPNAAPFPSVAAYIGPNGDAFADAFVALGDVYERRRRFAR